VVLRIVCVPDGVSHIPLSCSLTAPSSRAPLRPYDRPSKGTMYSIDMPEQSDPFCSKAFLDVPMHDVNSILNNKPPVGVLKFYRYEASSPSFSMARRNRRCLLKSVK